MGNKVLLIRPRNIYGISNYPSLALIRLATSLKEAGYEPVIINCALEDNPKQAIVRHLRESLLVGVTMMTSECPDAYDILRFVNMVSKVPAVVGGWHVTLFPEQMKSSNLVNYVIHGAGELDIVHLANRLAEGKSCPKMVPHKEPDIRKLNKPFYTADGDIEKFITSPLTDIGVERHSKNLRWLPYESSRGCPSRCRFCCNTVVGNNKWQGEDAESLANNYSYLACTYRLNHIKFIDDNFFVDCRRAVALTKLLTYQNFTWDAECRADYFQQSKINDVMLTLLRVSGLVQLTIGIESGSQETLDRMDKRITLDQAEYAVSQCNKHGIYARCSFIIEVPGETKADIEKTRKFVNMLRRKYRYFTCGVQTFRPYPRCELTRDLIDSGKWTEPNSFYRWTMKDNVEVFTKAQMRLPWQVQPKRSERMAAYQYIESGAALYPEQRATLRYRVFRLLARIRNRLGFYAWPWDLWLYRRYERTARE